MGDEDEILEDEVKHNSSKLDNNIFNIESMPKICEDIDLVLSDIENDSGNWNSEADYPLCIIGTQEMAKLTIWSKSSTNYHITFK